MNDTLGILNEFGGKRKTQELIGKIENLFEDYTNGSVLAAVVQVLVAIHIDTNMSETETICEPCSNANLTELVQAIRSVNDAMMRGIHKESH